jgi:signal transduction histidine kinase
MAVANTEATLAVRQVSGETELVLANEPPTPGQRRLALAIVAMVFLVFAVSVVVGLTAPFAHVQVPIDAFIPILAAVLFVNDVITAVLLFGQFSITRSRALLIIANAYLFTGLMAVLFALTFPGAFSPTGLLGAGLQSSAWLYNFWHYGFPLAVLLYAMQIGRGPADKLPLGSTRTAIGWSMAIVVGLVSVLAWFATAGEELLPRLFQDATHPTPLARIVTSANTLVCLVALVLLYVRQRSVLDLWLVVVMCAWLSELALLDVLLYSRFTFGFYVGRGFSLITSLVVLFVLIEEMTRLHTRLAQSNNALQRERNNKLMNLEAMAASIAHEINQPLSALVTNGSIGLRLLAKADYDLDEVRDVLTRIIDDGHRASGIITSIRAMFGRDRREKSLVSISDLVSEVLALAHSVLERHRVSLRVEAPKDLPCVLANRVQLRQVVLNLIVNAAEAMSSTDGRERSLVVKYGLHEGRDVLIMVEDSGPGIDSRDMDRIFDPFFTTKSHGMGLGLSICQSIVESHGGRLWASARKPHGAIFHVQLPSGTAVGE